MTQLDRLEALAEKWKEPGKRWYGIATVNESLPDLIRVARAAKEASDKYDVIADCLLIDSEHCDRAHLADGARFVEAMKDQNKATAPLFAEVKS